MSLNLLNDVDMINIGDAIANALNTNSNSTIIDMAGYEGCLFLTPINDSTATGVATLTIQQNSVNSGTGMAALTGGLHQATCVADDDINSKFLVVDVYRPRQRYLRANRTSATANIAFGSMIAIKYNGRKEPVSHANLASGTGVIVGSPA